MTNPGNRSAFRFLGSRASRLLSIVLLVQAAVFYGMSRKEDTPPNVPLMQLASQIGPWQLVQDTPIDKDTLDVLKADETLSRTYYAPQFGAANLFVAYFRTQRTGQTPHSPKNCLPGAGWVQSVADRVAIPIEGRTPIEVNRYIVSKGDARSVVLYWYQSRDRVVASEYSAKAYSVADAIRYNRSDTALVRVVVPVVDKASSDSANAAAIRFVQDVFQPLRTHFPA